MIVLFHSLLMSADNS